MRLWFSVAVLMVLACVLLEISEAKSNENSKTTKINHKSGNSKEVRYSKNSKSDFKKKGNNKKQVEAITKEKKSRRNNVQGNDNIEGNGKMQVSNEEQKREKHTNKGNKIGKNIENLKNNNKNIKLNKDNIKTKKHKRSVDIEQPKESLTNDLDSALQNEEIELNSASKKKGKNNFDTKSGNGIGKALNGESEVDGTVNIEGAVSDNQQSEETASLSDKSLKEGKNAERQKGKSKKLKEKKQSKNKDELNNENLDLKKSELKEEKIQLSEEPVESEKTSESLDDLQEKNIANGNEKKKKSSKKPYKYECQINNNKLSKSDNQKYVKEKSQKYKSESCNLKMRDSLEQNNTNTEESNTESDSMEDNEQQQIENEDSKIISKNFEEKKEDKAEESSIETENCIRADSIQENVEEEESCFTG